ncbi:hypothetical protein DM01DRAFT_1324882 [Hesseltinella vesiculosa]|uniref:RFX-type winged-helix domain-containing protein n=1 Tax=Hesseltinella vesiculosa TaxID=101127 RepID=A0A1X2GC85_9FUNG|nr:hypothetical protein DM01DRAFT_1324882 [Hesseltinella vesiculosa]
MPPTPKQPRTMLTRQSSKLLGRRSNPEFSVGERPTSTRRTTTTHLSIANVDKDLADLVIAWVEANYEVQANANVPRSGMYTHYQHFCTQEGTRHVNAATFGKLVRTVFPTVITRRLGNRGQSKYQYCNIQRRQPTAETEQPPGTDELATPYATNPAAGAPTTTATALAAFDLPSLFHTPHDDVMQVSAIDAYRSSPPSTHTGTHHQLPPAMATPYNVTLPALSPPAAGSTMTSAAASLPPVTFTSSSSTVSSLGSTPYLPGPGTHASSASSVSSLPTLASLTLPLIQQADLSAEQTDILRQFTYLYDRHCHDLFETILAGKFDQIQPLYHEFYVSMPRRYSEILEVMPMLVDSLWRWDCVLYDSLILALVPRVGVHMEESMLKGLQQYAIGVAPYLDYLLAEAQMPMMMRQRKTELAYMFSAKLRRHLALNKYASVMAGILSNGTMMQDMKRNWDLLDVGAILDHALWICDCRNDDMRYYLDHQIKELLALPEGKIEFWMNMVYNLVDKYLVRPRTYTNQEIDKFLTLARQFIMKWKTYTSFIIQQLHTRPNNSLDHFKSFQFFLDDFALYTVEERISSVNSTANKLMASQDVTLATPYSSTSNMTPDAYSSTPPQ